MAEGATLSLGSISNGKANCSPYEDEKGKGNKCVYTGENNIWAGSSVKYDDGTTVFTFPNKNKLVGGVEHIICKEGKCDKSLANREMLR